MKYGFAGDRQLSVDILEFLISEGYRPSFLIVGDSKGASHKQGLIDINGLEKSSIYGTSFMNDPKNVNILNDYDVDYFFGIHFPYIIYEEVLSIPKIGFLNLHPLIYLMINVGIHQVGLSLIRKNMEQHCIL